MDFLSIVTLLFIILDPIGLSPIIQSLLASYEPRQRMLIIIRELLFALVILLVFLFCGNTLLKFLGLNPATLNISGGVMLFMVALGMVFPVFSLNGNSRSKRKEDPFIVPIAVPLMAGPSSLAIILVNAAQSPDMHSMMTLCGAVTTAWGLAAIVLLCSQYVLRLLGNRGTVALERLMGMLLILISVQMFLNGLSSYSAMVK